MILNSSHLHCFVSKPMLKKKCILFLILLTTSLYSKAQLIDATDLNLLNGNNGIIIPGVSTDDQSGFYVSNTGDINNDGIDDVIIGAFNSAVGSDTSAVAYVVFGSAESKFNTPFELSSLNGSNGFKIIGINNSNNTKLIANYAGDINGDSLDDMIIASRRRIPPDNLPKETYDVIFGRSTGFTQVMDISSLDGNNGFTLIGSYPFQAAINEATYAGDVNNDGVDDIIIGSKSEGLNGLDLSGITYIVYGNSKGFSTPLELSDLDGNDGFKIYANQIQERSGTSVSNAGDVNGDGVDDIIIGAVETISEVGRSGSAYVVFGNPDGFNNPVELSELDGTNGFSIPGVREYEQLGKSVSYAGDVNADGVDDIIIGAPMPALTYGNAYVIFGDSNGFSSSLDLNSLDGSNGFVMRGRKSFGNVVRYAKDINADGVDDLIIGAPQWGFGIGYMYVIYGRKTAFPDSLEYFEIDSSSGFIVSGGDEYNRVGHSISTSGDFNGDGFQDVIVGNPNADSEGLKDNGASYILFGNDVIYSNNFELID